MDKPLGLGTVKMSLNSANSAAESLEPRFQRRQTNRKKSWSNVFRAPAQHKHLEQEL
jgi:hypothetical protein